MSDELRDLFHDEASAILAPRPDASAVTSGARRRVRRRRVFAASAAVVVTGAAVALGGAVLERDPRPVASDGSRLSVLARVPLASSWAEERGLVRDVAFAAGQVWVLREGEQTLQRIDPATNRVEEVLSFGPDAADAYWALGGGFGRLWLVGPRRDEVVAIDPATGEVTGRIDVPSPIEVLASGRYLWVQGSAGADGSGAAIHRVDPETLEIVGSVPMGAECCASGMVEHGGYLWVAHADVADTRRDPAADTEEAEFDLTNELRKIDPRDLTIVDAIALPGETYRPGDTVLGDLVAAAGYLWVSHTDGELVDRVDPARGTVESIDMRDVFRPGALSWFGDEVWAWEINGSLVAPIDPESLRVSRATDLGHTVSGWPVEGAGSLWGRAGSSGERPYILRVGHPGDVPPETPPPPPQPTPPPRGDVVEVLSEQEQAEIFAFRALADTGLMHPFSRRSYNFTSSDDTRRVGDAWRIGFAASDCAPREAAEGLTFTCTGLSGEDPKLGNPVTDTYVTVELDAGRWTVTGVEGNMPAEDRARVVGYELEQRPEPSHWEFRATGAWRTRDGVTVQMVALWVGPYPTEASGSVCEAAMLGAEGNRLGRLQRFYQEPPKRPFDRAGWVRMIGDEAVDDEVDRVVVDCYQRAG